VTRDAVRGLVLAEIPPNDLNLGSKMVERLASWGIVTVDDLTKVGWWEERVITEEDRPALRAMWRGYIPGLIEIKGMGPVRLARIRSFLAENGLALADEAEIAERQRQGLPF